MTSEPICPCENIVHPEAPRNLSGLSSVRYRVGDFRSFRRALLQSLPNEVDLPGWRPNSQGDLLLQTVEWWAYISDVLTFYNERNINERLLRTATFDTSVRGLVSILGYRPRPGIAGSATLGVLVSGNRPIALPAGFRVQSKPAPGKQPQTFETTQPYTLTLPDSVPVAPPGNMMNAAHKLFLDGQVKSIQPGDLLLLTRAGTQWDGTLITVRQVNFLEDSAVNPYTEIIPEGLPVLPDGDASGYRLLQSKKSSGVWKYPTTTNVVVSWIDMEGVDRGVQSGQAMVLNAPGTGLVPLALNIVETREEIWYTNGDGSSPPDAPANPAGAPHTELVYSGFFDTIPWNSQKYKIQILLGWEPVGMLRNLPVESYDGTPPILIAQGQTQFRSGNGQTLLIEDRLGNGAVLTASVSDSTLEQLQIASVGSTPVMLMTPLRVLENVVSVSRGKTVDAEILGVGNAGASPQEFTLKKSPLTYLPAGDGYKSTLRVYVDDIEWNEVKSFYNQPPGASVFVTREDDEQKTHVAFGDWINGAGLTAGAQVVASYRIESGADKVEPGGISVISKPVAGVRNIRQPLVTDSGADPDPRDQIRRYAPKSILTFGRAISSDDYDVIASQAPGVTRVRSCFAWNSQEQRATVTLYVGDDAAAVKSARDALQLSADPNRPVSVLAAKQVRIALFLSIRVEPGRILEDVVALVKAALTAPDTGLIGLRRTGVGESIYFSQISECCLAIPGVDAVTFALFLLERPDPVLGPGPLPPFNLGLPPRINASENEFFTLAPELLSIYPEVLTGV